MKKLVILLLALQSLLTFLFLLVIHVLRIGDLFSALVGCLASLIPATYQGVKMVLNKEHDDAQQWLGFAYRVDLVKWLMTGMIFILAFTSQYTWDPATLFIGYLLVQMSGILIPLVQKGN